MGLKRHNAVRISRVVGAAHAGWQAGTDMARAFKRKRSSSTSHVSRTSSRSAPSTGRRVKLTFRRGSSQRRGKKRTSRRGGDNQLASGKDTSGFTYKTRGFVTKGKLSFISAINIYRYCYSQRLTTNGGLQNYDLLGYDGAGGTGIGAAGLFNVTDVSIIKSKIGQIQTPTTVGNNNSTQFAIPVGKAEYQISNSTNANIIAWIYDIVPRRFVQIGDTNYESPMVAWVNGMRIQTGTGGGSDVAQFIGCKPFESKLFCEIYKVKKVTKVVLSPGVLHRHIVKSTQRRWWSDTQFQNLFNAGVPITSGRWFGGRTVLSMIVIQGTPAHSRANPDSAHTTSAPAGIDVVTLKSYEFLYSATGTKQVIWTDGIPGAAGDIEAVPEAQGAFNTIVTA